VSTNVSNATKAKENRSTHLFLEKERERERGGGKTRVGLQEYNLE
jgi:hypothetical protein